MNVVGYVIIKPKCISFVAITVSGNQIWRGIIVFGRYDPEFESESQTDIQIFEHFGFDAK